MGNILNIGKVESRKETYIVTKRPFNRTNDMSLTQVRSLEDEIAIASLESKIDTRKMSNMRVTPLNANENSDVYTYFLDTPWESENQYTFPDRGLRHPHYNANTHIHVRNIDNNLYEHRTEYELVAPLRSMDIKRHNSPYILEYEKINDQFE